MIPFDDWYVHYPNKKSRGAAIKAWEKLKPDQALFEEMVNALNIQKRWRQEKAKTNEFMPPWKVPATWLNGQCWLDQLDGTFADLKEKQSEQNYECDAGGKFCTKKATVRGSSGWMCPWCFSEFHSDMDLLRDGFIRHGLAKKPDETKEDWRKRLVQSCREAAARFGARQKTLAQQLEQGRHRRIEGIKAGI